MTTRSLATVTAHVSQVIDEVVGTHERVVVTENGSPVAVILAVEDYESLMETLEILSDPTAVAQIRDAQARMDDGEAFGEDDIRATLAARRARPHLPPTPSSSRRRPSAPSNGTSPKRSPGPSSTSASERSLSTGLGQAHP